MNEPQAAPVASLAEQVLKCLFESEQKCADPHVFKYRDPASWRRFEITSALTGEPSEHAYRACELVPTGKRYQRSGDRNVLVEDPQILETARFAGPNALMVELSGLGIDPDTLQLEPGPEATINTVHCSLRSAANAIADVLISNTRFVGLLEPTAQDLIRQQRKQEQDHHAYWRNEKRSMRIAMTRQGRLQGCYTEFGSAHSPAFLQQLNAYFAAPNREVWESLSGLAIVGTISLSDAIRLTEVNQETEGGGTYPSAEQLQLAIRQAVAHRTEDIEENLRGRTASGLRVV